MSDTTPKYEILRDDVRYLPYGEYTFRIRALRDFGSVRKGDLGGYIQYQDNLSHDGLAWVADGAWVGNSTRVYEDAWVGGYAVIGGWSHISGKVVVDGHAVISRSSVTDNAHVSGHAYVCNYAVIRGNTQISGDAEIDGGVWQSGICSTGFHFNGPPRSKAPSYGCG